jgi:hypothetical protein
MAAADIRRPTVRSTTSKIGDVMPTAATLFHELFHLVLGNAATAPSTGKGEVYLWAEVRALSAANAIRNPETYTFAAVAYDITLHGGVEFYAQYAVRV